MIEPEELLQQKLEQLEAGAPLESCLVDLSDQEARILRLAGALRHTSFPQEDTSIVAAQRVQMLNAARETAMQPERPSTTNNLAFLDALRLRLDALLSQRQLATGLVAALAVVLLIFVWAGVTRWSARDNSVAEAPATSVAGQAYPAPRAEATGATSPATPGTTAEAVAAVPDTPPAGAVDPDHQAYMPLISSFPTLDPQTAVVQEVQGIVEVRTGDGAWTMVTDMAALSAGQRVRTGPLSSATLSFFDDSQALLGPETELSIDELNAQRPEQGFRTVVLTQWLGESEHEVEFRNDQGSRYEVKTPAGNGVARGTRFRVVVTPLLLARFIVVTGQVDVSNLNSTVSLIAGQLTTIIAGQPPAPPVFRIFGEGEVTQIGTSWIIAGQSFQTHQHTVIIGNPQVGDLVRVDGHLLPDGSRMADTIVLLRRAVTNHFQLTGEVEAMGNVVWTVAGQSIIVNNDTRIDDDITIGATVRVEGVILPGGTLRATRIRLLEETAGLPFSFVGVVQQMGANTWRISGQTVDVNDNTRIDAGLAVGDLVAVNGRILDDDTWLARRIERIDDPERSFEFTGTVQSIAPWRVAGIRFATRDWTMIEPGIEAGSRVRVRGVILTDGTWVASSIELLQRAPTRTLVFIGIVASINPWIVNGLPLVTDDDTVITGDIVVGTLVWVEVRLLPDGTWLVVRIRPINTTFGLGCLTLTTVVVSVGSGQIVLRHWPALPLNNVQVVGEPRPDSIVTLPICTRFDGVIIIVTIVVIHQPVIIIAPPGPGNQNSPRPQPQPQPPPPPRSNRNHNG